MNTHTVSPISRFHQQGNVTRVTQFLNVYLSCLHDSLQETDTSFIDQQILSNRFYDV